MKSLQLLSKNSCSRSNHQKISILLQSNSIRALGYRNRHLRSRSSASTLLKTRNKSKLRSNCQKDSVVIGRKSFIRSIPSIETVKKDSTIRLNYFRSLPNSKKATSNREIIKIYTQSRQFTQAHNSRILLIRASISMTKQTDSKIGFVRNMENLVKSALKLIMQ
jgi:hypothetical protein